MGQNKVFTIILLLLTAIIIVGTSMFVPHQYPNLESRYKVQLAAYLSLGTLLLLLLGYGLYKSKK